MCVCVCVCRGKDERKMQDRSCSTPSVRPSSPPKRGAHPHHPSQTAHHLLQADQRMSRVGPGVDGGVGFFVKYLWSQLQRHIRTKPLRTVCVCVCMCGCKSANAGGEGDSTHPHTYSAARNRSWPPSSICEKKAEEQERVDGR